MKTTSTPTMPTLAATITKATSKQSYYTVRYLVDRDRVEDAYRAYAYFRWVDDILDAETGSRPERCAFASRQKALLERCYKSEPAGDVTPEETMLVEMVRGDTEQNSGLQAYLRNMMAVMSFDADRRGRLISQPELDAYTHWLAVAVTEALHYFIGHDDYAPRGDIRFLAVTGAHITHMLRDALEDADAGYYNIPREVISAHGIAPWDVRSKAYRDWVKENVQKARTCFKVGRDYLAQVENLRCRIAGYAYIRRFEIVLDCIEHEGCLLRAVYPERKACTQKIKMLGWALWMALNHHQPGSSSIVKLYGE
jgi:phytoene/squalene synthetase